MNRLLLLHTFSTWLVANLIHPVMMAFASLILPEVFFNLHEEGGLIVLLTFVLLLVSLPCLLTGWLCLMIIVPAPHSLQLRFLVWMVAAPCIIVLQGLIMMLFAGTTSPGMLIGLVPAMLAVLLSVLIRYRQFKQLTVQHEIN
jgi:hypothetical protein